MKIENQISSYGTNKSQNTIIIAHETANDRSTIDDEVAYMKRNWTAAFVTHFVGGGGRIIQTANSGMISWGAGRTANNYAYAQVELCRTKIAQQFKKDYAAYVWLLRTLAGEAKLPITLDTGNTVQHKGVKTHKWVSDNLGGTDHQDPYGYLASWGISKEQFKNDIKSGINGTSSAVPSVPTLVGTYTVKRGDTLWGIANTHESTVEKIKEINRLKSNTILIGQKLNLLKPAPIVQRPAKGEPASKEIIRGIQGTVGANVDGWDGPETRKRTVALAQRWFGANDDGSWGPESRSKAKTIRRGDQGWHVFALQAMLYLKGYTSVGIPDGDFGTKTNTALLKFQTDHKLDRDALAGKATLSLVFKR